MLEFLSLLIHALAAPFSTQAQLGAEITMLRHQLNVLRRQTPRPRLTAADRLLFVWLCWLFPSLRSAIRLFSQRRCCAGIVLASGSMGDGVAAARRQAKGPNRGS
jgi:hypothetical protein